MLPIAKTPTRPIFSRLGSWSEEIMKRGTSKTSIQVRMIVPESGNKASTNDICKDVQEHGDRVVCEVGKY